MPTYTVIVTRDLTESVVVEVEADNEDEAGEEALKKVDNMNEAMWPDGLPKWEIDEGSEDTSYISDCTLKGE